MTEYFPGKKDDLALFEIWLFFFCATSPGTEVFALNWKALEDSVWNSLLGLLNVVYDQAQLHPARNWGWN